MIIPSKFNGFHNGVRRCFGDGGGDGGGGGDGTNNDYAPPANRGNTGNTNVNTNRGSVTGMNFNSTGNTYGTSPISLDNPARRAMGGLPYNQSGQYYNSLLQQGYTGNDIRNSLTTQGRPVSDSDYGFLVQNAAMTSPTSRPFAGSDQFFQPVYNTSYQNYARPATQFDVSSYGTQASNSPLLNRTSRNTVNTALNDFYNTNYRDNPNGMGMGDTLDFMREKGINRDDFQAWGGVKNYGPQMSMPSAQTQQFNPYTNNSGYGGFGQQMQSPFSYQPQTQMQSPFSYQQQSYQPSYQQPSFQPQQQYNPYQQYEQSLGSYNPYQMQTPFSYQQPAAQPEVRLAGSGISSRPVRRAEGGIASLMDDVA